MAIKQLPFIPDVFSFEADGKTYEMSECTDRCITVLLRILNELDGVDKAMVIAVDLRRSEKRSV